jgi:hypothetical protein
VSNEFLLLCSNAGIRHGRSSSEDFYSLGIVMKSPQFESNAFFGVIDIAVIVN